MNKEKRSGWISKKLNEQFVIPHSDGCGEVVDVFSKSDKKMIGKKFWICGGSKENILGTCAQYYCTNKNHLIPIPKNTSLIELCRSNEFTHSHPALHPFTQPFFA